MIETRSPAASHEPSSCTWHDIQSGRGGLRWKEEYVQRILHVIRGLWSHSFVGAFSSMRFARISILRAFRYFIVRVFETAGSRGTSALSNQPGVAFGDRLCCCLEWVSPNDGSSRCSRLTRSQRSRTVFWQFAARVDDR